MKKKSENNFDFLMPDGSKPDATTRESIARSIKELAIVPGSKNYLLHPVDSNAWIQASTELETSGFRNVIDEDSSPIAFANVLLRAVDEDKDIVSGIAILTNSFLTLHWKNRRESRGFKFFHPDLLGGDVTSSTSSILYYSNSIRKSNDEFLNLGDFAFEIRLIPSNEGHENRRTLTFWMTLEQYLSRKIPGLQFISFD